jgi:MFS superfamily sulfate permease-like transporter
MSVRLPLPDWVSDYRREWLGSDLVAGLTTAAVVIPKSLAYATVAGLPIQVGLYTAFVPLIIYAVLGTSRPLSVTTSATLAILTAAQLGQVAPNGDTSALLHATTLLTLMVGAVLILASVLRLGFVANFISEPILVGFKAGIGVVVVVDQIPKVLGLHFTKGSFLHNAASIVLGLPHTSIPTLAMGVFTIAGLAVIEKLRPRWPAPLIIVAAAVAAVGLFALQSSGISLVGAIPAGLPTITVPDVGLARELWPGALGIALMSFAETVAAGRAFAKNDEPPPRPNTELIATGMANAAGAFLGSMPAGGGTSQTAVNRMTGARTQLASIVTAAMALSTMLLLSPLVARRAHAERRAGGHRHRVFHRSHQASRFPRHPAHPNPRIHLGDRGLPRRHAARNPAGHPGGDHRVAGRPRAPDGESARVRARTQARHECLPTALIRTPRR